MQTHARACVQLGTVQSLVARLRVRMRVPLATSVLQQRVRRYVPQEATARAVQVVQFCVPWDSTVLLEL